MDEGLEPGLDAGRALMAGERRHDNGGRRGMAADDYTLVIGDKNISSWSLRPWLALKQCGIPFAEERVRLTAARLQGRDPAPFAVRQGAGAEDRAPAWSGTASPSSNISPSATPSISLWPEDAEARAAARSISAEMHSGFATLRNDMSMDLLEHGCRSPPIERGARSGHQADRRDLEGHARALRPRRSVPVRRLHQCRCHVSRRWRRASAPMASILPASATTARRRLCSDLACLPAMAEWTEGAIAEMTQLTAG